MYFGTGRMSELNSIGWSPIQISNCLAVRPQSAWVHFFSMRRFNQYTSIDNSVSFIWKFNVNVSSFQIIRTIWLYIKMRKNLENGKIEDVFCEFLLNLQRAEHSRDVTLNYGFVKCFFTHWKRLIIDLIMSGSLLCVSGYLATTLTSVQFGSAYTWYFTTFKWHCNYNTPAFFQS